jgi:hypothetical protein
MLKIYQIFIISLLVSCSGMPVSSFDKKNEIVVAPDQEWILVTRSSNYPYGGEPLYMHYADALNTHRAREFNEWDIFSLVDTRNLKRIKKDSKVKVVEMVHNNKIVKVKVVDHKKELYIIKEDLINKFELIEEINS